MEKRKLKKKWIIVIPILFFLACSAVSWWLNSNYSRKTSPQNKDAFNTRMPTPDLKNATKNKLEIYMEAQKDSAKRREQLKKDSSDLRWFDPGPPPTEDEIYANEYPPKSKKSKTNSWVNPVDQNEKKVNDRLEKLYAALNENNQPEDKISNEDSGVSKSNFNDISHLENMLMHSQDSDSSDPEMTQLERMLDKIIKIQHPEKLNNQKLPDSTQTFLSVSTTPVSNDSENNSSDNSENGFWGLEGIMSSDQLQNQNTITAVVYSNQVVQDNSTIELRLLQNIYIKDQLIPKGNFITGICKLTNDRVQVQLNNIVYNNIIYPVALTVFDTDGLEGIRIFGGTGYDATKNELNQAVQNLQLYSLNPSIAAQATSTGIQTIKTLLTKNRKKPQTLVKAGHKVLLKSNNHQ